MWVLACVNYGVTHKHRHSRDCRINAATSGSVSARLGLPESLIARFQFSGCANIGAFGPRCLSYTCKAFVGDVAPAYTPGAPPRSVRSR